MRGVWIGLLGVLLAGCAARQPDGEGGMPRLAGTLEVEVAGDTAWLTLHVTNATDAPQLLEYPTAQRYDFEVRTPSGERVWHWAGGRMFAQVVSEERLEPGASLRFREGWAPARPGDYVAVARLTSSSHGLELRLPFTVGGR